MNALGSESLSPNQCLTPKQYLSLKQWLILLLTSLLLLIPGQISLPVMDRDEARYAQASKQMLETGDYIDIRFQEQTRYVKPVLTYWLQSASATVFGAERASITAYRLPSLLGALAAIMAVAWLGARIGGANIGLLAGLMLAASMIIAIEARTAKTDALLLAATTISMAALYCVWQERNSPRDNFFAAPLLFWLATGLGLMIKGPLILLVSVTTMLALSVVEKSWTWLGRLHPIKGLCLLALIVAPWLIMITIKTNGQFLSDSLGHALLGKVTKSDDSHGMPPGYHLIVYFACFWPASIFTALQNVYAFKNRHEESIKFLLCWIWPSWIIFELVVTKLPHYTLPLYPAIAILTSLALTNAKHLLEDKFTYRLQFANVLIFVVFTILLISVPAGLSIYFTAPPLNDFDALGLYEWFSLISGVLVILASIFVAYQMLAKGNGKQQTALRLITPLIVTTAIFYCATFNYMLPDIKSLWPSSQLAQKMNTEKLCQNKPVAISGYPEPSNVYYLGTNTRLTAPETAAALLARGEVCPLIVIEEKERKKFLSAATDLGLNLLVEDQISGFNVSKGKMITLTIFRQQITNGQ